MLKPLSYLTDALSGEKEVTASAVVPLLKHVKTKCTPTAESSRLAKEMQTTIWSDIEPRYSSYVVSETLSIASLLDPRFKDQYLQDKQGTLLSVKGECIPNDAQSDSSVAFPSTTEETTAETEVPPAKRLKGLAAVLQFISNEEGAAAARPTLTPAEKIDKEIEAYFDLPVASSDTDPLTWWRMEHNRFPHLAQLARKYLCICGTSVPSERVFSTAGHICNDSRSRLLPENVNKLIFLAKNMK